MDESALRWLAQAILGLLCFRTATLFVVSTWTWLRRPSRGVRISWTLCAAVAIGGVGLGVGVQNLWQELALAMAFFALVGTLIWWSTQWLLKLPRLAAFSLLALVYLGASSRIFLNLEIYAAVVLFGWDQLLSSYSYLANQRGASSTKRTPLSELLFFLLVDPMVVYTARARLKASLRAGIGKVSLGMGLLILSIIWSRFVSRPPQISSPEELLSFKGYTLAISTYGLQLLGLYFSHAGLALLQIGWLSWLGYHLPDRYRRPYLACSPRDFWNRWNLWVGHWIRMHVFLPSARAWQPALGRRLSVAASAMFAFLCVGVLHDAPLTLMAWARGGTATLFSTAFFMQMGLLVVAWSWIAGFIASCTPKGAVRAGMNWIVFHHGMAICGWTALIFFR